MSGTRATRCCWVSPMWIRAPIFNPSARRVTAGARERRCQELISRGRSSPRVMLAMERLEALARDVGVDLRGRNVRMPEEELHHAQIGAVIDEVRREGVAQSMRGNRLANAGRARMALHQRPERLTCHRRATRSNEKRLGLAPGE